MSSPHGIIVFGANGSGKTTLGRELAHVLGFKHMDHEAYAFKESEIPYTNQRSNEECVAHMLADIESCRGFVLSAVAGDFGDVISQYYEFAVCVSAPLDLRLKRIEQRGYELYGNRARKGGDMYEGQIKFIDFAASRPLERIDQWAATLTCPVIRVDGTEDWRTNAEKIAKQYLKSTEDNYNG